MSQRIPLILDVDTGIDDAAAISLAVHSPDAELIAVTTVAGNTAIDNVVRNTLDVLDLLGANSVPVHRGASRPLVRELFQAPHAHGSNGVGGAELPHSSRAVAFDRGPAAIVRMANERPGEISLVCLGPLTNLAIALNVEPRLPTLLRSLVIMGGAFWNPGNIAPDKHAEFNLYVDPEAANQVLQGGFKPLYAVGLDVTHEAPMDTAVWEALLASQSVPAGILRELYRERIEKASAGTAYIHDAMAVAAALDPDLIEWELNDVTIATDEHYRGLSTLKAGDKALVARSVDSPEFMSRFFERLGIAYPVTSTS